MPTRLQRRAIEAQNIYLEAQDVVSAGAVALSAADKACTEAAVYPDSKVIVPSTLYTIMSDCEVKTGIFADKADTAAGNTTLAATTAALSETAAESASAAVADWASDAESDADFDQGNIDQIYEVRADVSDAYNEALDYEAQAESNASAAAIQAANAQTAVDTAKSNLIKVTDAVNKLLDTITAEQYANTSSLLKTIADLGYEGSDQIQELIYILELRVTINTNLEADALGCSVYRTSDGLNYTPVTTNGFNDKFNYGLRTFLPTTKGLFMGMANPFYGAQFWKLGDFPSSDTGGGGHGGGGGSASTITIAAEPVALGAVTLGALNMNDHFAYVLGYDDGTIKPREQHDSC